jgi:DNA-binding SARP family transcriptional activator
MAKSNQTSALHEPDTLTPDQLGGVPGWNADIPAIRISTCGPFTVEILETLPEDKPACYVELSPKRVREHDGRALTLLRLLSNAEGRYVSKDQLMTWLCEGRKASITEKTLQNIISSLRDLLTLSNQKKIPDLIVYVKGTRESGDGYRLAAFPLVWLDSDAITWNIETATLKQRFNDDPFPYWQRAYQLASRGTYLIEEPLSDWANVRRQMIKDQLRQCVHALARLYLVRFGEVGEEEVMRMLLSYCRIDPLDEDALRSLLELLCKRGRYQEVLSWFGCLEDALDEAGLTKTGEVRTPHPSTAEIAAYAQLKLREEYQVKDEPLSLTPADGSVNVASSTVHTPSASIAVPGPHVHNDTSMTRVLEAASGEGELPHSSASVCDHLEAFTGPLHSETHHLIGREVWLSHIVQMVGASLPKKLIILHGPIGIGKSSELNRLAEEFRHLDQGGMDVLAPALFAIEQHSDPEAALDVFLGMVLHQCQDTSFPANASRQTLTNLVLAALERRQRSLVILLDNAECLLTEDGRLASCWQTFLTRYLRSRHQTTLILATKEWHDWSTGDKAFLEETSVPSLTPAESVSVLQHLGLGDVSVELLAAVGRYLDGIPLLLEWTVTLVTDSHLFAYWEVMYGSNTCYQTSPNTTSERLQRLLDNPSDWSLHLADKLAPLLQCLLDKYLSASARLVLNRLAVTMLPLGQPALRILCPRPLVLQELRSASLLVAYTNRIQLLPIVAWTVQQQLTPEQRREAEDVVIEAYMRWLDEGSLDMQEAGTVVTELAVLLLMHHRLLEAAELLINQGWLSFHCGSGSRLARLSQAVLSQVEWRQSIEEECAGLALINTVFPFLGEPLHMQAHGDYPRLREAFLAGELSLSATLERSTTHLLLLDALECRHFKQGQAILDAYCGYLKARQIEHPQLQTGLIQEQALLLGEWCDYLLEQQEKEQASAMREQAIALYRQCVTRFSAMKTSLSVVESIRKKALAYTSAFLGYHLNQIGRPEEALPVIQQALDIHKQKYGHTSILADSYSEKAQALMALGHFQEALLCDEQAMTEIHRWAKERDIHSQNDVWTYQVNRGRLYVRLGRMEEAEQLLLEAEPRLSESRRNYRMFAKEALEEIKLWKSSVLSPQHQLDWRWVERFRELVTYDSYWWLTWAGPFTAEEQQEWDRLFALPLDETTKAQLGALMTSSRERELAAALEEQREPRLHYPAIEIEEIRRRIQAQQALDAEIASLEPNVIVKKLYREAIADELDYLRLIEATYEGNTERFWECAKRSFPLPSREEMIYALGYLQDLIERGLAAPEPAAVQETLQFQEYLSIQLHLSPDLLAEATAFENKPLVPASPSPASERSISAEAAQRFFATVLQESGYEGWQVVLDPHGGMARVERGARRLFLRDKCYSLADIRHLFVHELAGHVGYCIAGEHSRLGLLGVQMKNCGPIQEGIALYHERQVLASRGEALDDGAMRLGMLAVGLAAGVITLPQTFRRLCSFLEQVILLIFTVNDPLAEHSNARREAAHRYALNVCLRTYRGVPDLEQAGICYPQDVIHLRGLRLVEQAVATDASVLDRIVGVCPLEHLPDLQELGILSASQPLLRLAYATDLDEYIYSFEKSKEKGGF